MSLAFMGFSFAIWTVLFALDSIGAQVTGNTDTFNALVQFSIFREAQVDLLFLSFTFPVPNTSWFSAVGDAVTWNQWLFTGWATWVRLIAYLPLTAAFVGPLIVTLFGAILTRR